MKCEYLIGIVATLLPISVTSQRQSFVVHKLTIVVCLHLVQLILELESSTLLAKLPLQQEQNHQVQNPNLMLPRYFRRRKDELIYIHSVSLVRQQLFGQ
jgi:hypothetical protein